MTQDGNGTGRSDDVDVPPGMPRWVRVTAIVVGLLILVVLVLQLTGLAGEHGPGRHSSVGPSPVGVAAERLAADG